MFYDHCHIDISSSHTQSDCQHNGWQCNEKNLEANTDLLFFQATKNIHRICMMGAWTILSSVNSSLRKALPGRATVVVCLHVKSSPEMILVPCGYVMDGVRIKDVTMALRQLSLSCGKHNSKETVNVFGSKAEAKRQEPDTHELHCPK